MVRADVQDERGVRHVVQQALVAFVRLDHEIPPESAAVVPRRAMFAEPFHIAAGQHPRIAAETVQGVRQPRAHGRFAAGSRHGDGEASAQRPDPERQRLAPVEAARAGRRAFEVRVVLLDRGRVYDGVRRIAVGIDRAVLRIKFRAAFAERREDAFVLRAAERAVAAGHGASEVAEHLRESAHADPADADEVYLFRKFRLCAGGCFSSRFRCHDKYPRSTCVFSSQNNSIIRRKNQWFRPEKMQKKQDRK